MCIYKNNNLSLECASDQKLKYSDIYKKLGDDLSKKIFGYRLLFSETEDTTWIHELLNLIPEGKDFLRAIQNNLCEKVIFGVGAWGKELADVFQVGWSCFLDNYNSASNYNGIPIVGYDEYLQHHKDAVVFLTARLHYPSMLKQLLEGGIDEKKIINMGKIVDDMSKKQYFDLDILPHHSEEVFVDCGCLDGVTSRSFIKWCNGNYKMIYAFEPDANQVQKCKNNLKSEKVNLYDVGLWDCKDELRFEGALEGSSYISECGKHVIRVDKLDDILIDENVTFIKMDIEGSEKRALKGAKELIVKNKPKMAISVYHKPEDIIEIPRLLLDYNEDYVFYLRHYSVLASETVLYAI